MGISTVSAGPEAAAGSSWAPLVRRSTDARGLLRAPRARKFLSCVRAPPPAAHRPAAARWPCPQYWETLTRPPRPQMLCPPPSRGSSRPGRGPGGMGLDMSPHPPVHQQLRCRLPGRWPGRGWQAQAPGPSPRAGPALDMPGACPEPPCPAPSGHGLAGCPSPTPACRRRADSNNASTSSYSPCPVSTDTHFPTLYIRVRVLAPLRNFPTWCQSRLIFWDVFNRGRTCPALPPRGARGTDPRASHRGKTLGPRASASPSVRPSFAAANDTMTSSTIRRLFLCHSCMLSRL